MRVVPCSGQTPCSRLVSISQVAGGNPVARENPDAYAVDWTRCTCGAFTCDRCLAAQGGKCTCGAAAALLSDAEKIAIALGGPPPAPEATPIQPRLDGIARAIEEERAKGNHDRARALGALAATVVETQGASAPDDELAGIAAWGERFHEWAIPAEGARYAKATLQLLALRGRGPTSAEGQRAAALAGAFDALAGALDASSPYAYASLQAAKSALGDAHPIARAAQDKLGTVAPPPNAPHGAPPPNLAPPAPEPASRRAGFDGVTGLAVWITLAFLEIAMADGVIDESEHAAYARAIERAGLPDAWARFGRPALEEMSKKGMLQELSMEYAGLPLEVRTKMAEALVEFMMADGKIDPGEVESIRRITGWLGVSISLPNP